MPKNFAALVALTAFFALSGCTADGGVQSTNNAGMDAGTDGSNNISNNQNNTNNSGTNNANNGSNNQTNGMDMGMDTGVDMAPAKPTVPTIFVPTNGGGTSTSTDHQLTISVGAPQPHGQAEDGEHRLLLGPIVPTGN